MNECMYVCMHACVYACISVYTSQCDLGMSSLDSLHEALEFWILPEDIPDHSDSGRRKTSQHVHTNCFCFKLHDLQVLVSVLAKLQVLFHKGCTNHQHTTGDAVLKPTT